MSNVLLRFLGWAVTALFCAATWAQSVPYQPGRYTWKVEDGEVQLVAARYTNRNSFDNLAYTFYFEPTDKKQLYIIPVNGPKPGDTSLTTTSASGGEWRFSDLAVQRQGNALHLIKVRQDTKNGWADPGDLTVERYVLTKGDEEEFPYQFVQRSKNVTPSVPRISVDEEIKKQLKMAPR